MLLLADLEGTKTLGGVTSSPLLCQSIMFRVQDEGSGLAEGTKDRGGLEE